MQNPAEFPVYKMSIYHQECNFPSADEIPFTYICLKNESCCLNGCCVTSFRKMAQFWYFWVILVCVCVGFLACFHYYRKIKDERFFIQAGVRRRPEPENLQRLFIYREEPEIPVRNTLAEVYPQQPNLDEILLEHLFVSFRGSNQMPPDYSTIEKSGFGEPPPRYSQICSRLQDDETQLQVDILSEAPGEGKKDDEEDDAL